ncbi:MAG TPA: DUF6325 family protein [Streptosporangiaceae bacterium]|nr:DUF6325 family protein [Streptosporangiaceae bacterium]
MADVIHAEAIGPIDVAVVTFEQDQFSSDFAPALIDLQTRGIVRLIDMAVVHKDANGVARIAEITDKEVLSVYSRLGDPRFDLVSKADAAALASALPPASAALVVVWENSWVGRFAAAVRASRGHVAAFERIPFETVQEAVNALNELNRQS